MRKIAVIIYGPPGSGKSTQADLVAEKYGLIRFDVGKHIAGILRDPENRKDKFIQSQKKLYESGLLCDRTWVFNLFAGQLKKIFSSGYGVVIAGSPRAPDEAFNKEKLEGILPMLIKNYGAKNVYIFSLKVKIARSTSRNQNRKLCIVCGHQYLFTKARSLHDCPFCGAPLKTRRDDNAKVIGTRIKEFNANTTDIFNGIKRLGLPIRIVDAEGKPFEVLSKISRWLS